MKKKVGFVSVKNGIDLGTASGKLMLAILAGVAQFETEVSSERNGPASRQRRSKGNAGEEDRLVLGSR